MNAHTVITIFNARIDKAERREVFVPTRISYVSYAEARGSTRSRGMISEALSFKLRIPVDAHAQDGRTYVSEAVYKTLSDDEADEHWTLRKGDYIITAQSWDVPETVSQQELSALAVDMHADLIRITEYADNTDRGSGAVKHWRVGGA